jgi:hypothetical protein
MKVWIGQAMLIVLPVVILSGVALHFLREDRAAIEQDAKRRAYSIAPDAARQIGDEISAYLIQSRKQGIVTEGEIVDGRGMAIPDYPRFPEAFLMSAGVTGTGRLREKIQSRAFR